MDEFDDDGDNLLCSVEIGNISDSTKLCDQYEMDDNDDELIAAADDKPVTNSSTFKDKPVTLPEKFAFPFEPYDIQVGFMEHLYKCLELGKIGIFESPTGTGKSLSLICGALRWLKDFQEAKKAELEKLLTEQAADSEENKENQKSQSKSSTEELDWISDFKKKQDVEDKSKKIKEEAELSLKRESRLSQIRKSRKGNKRKRVQLEDDFDELLKTASPDIKQAYQSEVEKLGSEDAAAEEDDDNLVLTEYHSDDAASDSDGEKEDEERYHCTKIYFCSRTHSQLSQFVREVIKSPYGDDTRVISLGSRQNLCVNSAVKKLKSLTLINETCRDLQKKKSGVKTASETKRKRTGLSQGCPYYRQEPIEDFGDQALVEVRDIEQLVSLGQQIKACPYYGTRRAIPEAEIVALPYNTLLHKSTREASGIQIKDNIVIIDEAHNLLETINNVHSMEVTGAQLVKAHSQLCQYEAKYRSRLKAQNLMYIKQILFILGKLTGCLGGKTDQPADKQTCTTAEQKLWTINNFLFSSQLDNVNMFKVLRYCHRSQISKKLHGFVEKYQSEIVQTEKDKKEESAIFSVSKFLKSLSGKEENSSNQEAEGTSNREEKKEVTQGSPLMHIEGFLGALTGADKDGRIVLTKTKLVSQSGIKFLLLNPAVHFASVVQEARAVVVAGGTMQPVSEFKDQLFHAAGVSPERILEYSCGHVIAADQILPIAVSSGPTCVPLDFTFQNRTNPRLLDEVGRCVQNVCNIVPGGVICFFPSYDYEKLVHSHWEKTGLLAKLEGKKKLFREPRRAGQVDQVLHDYSACIQNCRGAVTGSLLLCVVGGKMSEGINFSDDLGRCVIMIGMPYPNINSPELKEKMDYLNAKFPRDKEGKQPGQVHYENLCMKAVNQSIGRAIRHRNDYATILLLDRRYARASTVAGLPGWISTHLQKMDKFGQVFAAISKFFSSKKTR